jgi:stage V sporulation protein AD
MRGMARRAAGSFAVEGVRVAGWGTVVGKMEAEGPLGAEFDSALTDDLAGEGSWEAAERALWVASLARAAERAGIEAAELDLVLGGDLLDQLYSTNFAGREHQAPMAGVFSACATFTEAVGLGALLIAGGGPGRVAAVAASHHLAAERQFRFPVELGYQRTPTASWTATAAGALILGTDAGTVRVTGVTFGRVIDRGSKNPMDMGTAMAPAAADTLSRHLAAFERRWTDYDRVYTGDLGHVGSRILHDLVDDPAFRERHDDCGRALYAAAQDAHNGGSGAGCAAAVFSGPILRRLREQTWRRVLLLATGALFSPTSYQQGETIPCIAHAVEFESEAHP